jgi:transposase
MSVRYSAEFRGRALRLLEEARPDYPSEWAATNQIASKLGCDPETLRKWVRRAEVDAGVSLVVTSKESGELSLVRREYAELGRAKEILKTAPAFFAPSWFKCPSALSGW